MIFVSSRESAEDVWEPSADGRQPVHIRDFADFLIFCDLVRENTVPNRKSGSNDLQNSKNLLLEASVADLDQSRDFGGIFFVDLDAKIGFQIENLTLTIISRKCPDKKVY